MAHLKPCNWHSSTVSTSPLCCCCSLRHNSQCVPSVQVVVNMSLSVSCSVGPLCPQVTLAIFLCSFNWNIELLLAPTYQLHPIPGSTFTCRNHHLQSSLFAEILQIFHIPRSKSKQFGKSNLQIFLRYASLFFALGGKLQLLLHHLCERRARHEAGLADDRAGSHLLPPRLKTHSTLLCYAALGYSSSVFKFNCSLNSLYRCSAFSRPPNMVSFRVSFQIIYILQPVRTQ